MPIKYRKKRKTSKQKCDEMSYGIRDFGLINRLLNRILIVIKKGSEDLVQNKLQDKIGNINQNQKK